jgi:hypothetical protein
MPTMIIALMMTINIRTTELTVTEVNPITTEVTVVENDGNEWVFYGDNFTEGEIIQVHFRNDHVIGVVEK